MLSNFRKRLLDPPHQEQQSLLSPIEFQADTYDDYDYDYDDYPQADPMNDDVATQRYRAIAVAKRIVAECNCASCIRRPEFDDDVGPARTPTRKYARHSFPSTRSVVQVLYPPSYLSTPRPFPDPSSHSPIDSPPDAEVFPSTFSTTTSTEGIPLSSRRPDPLAQHPSLTGVPSPPSGRVPSVKPDPLISLGGDVEPLPANPHFDRRGPRFPVASDVLGPYPPLSVYCQAAR